MHSEGPLLEQLTRRLAECPPDFLAEPRIGAQGSVHVSAVVADLMRALGGALTAEQLRTFNVTNAKQHRNRLCVVLIACWLLYDEWFRARADAAWSAQVWQLLSDGATDLAAAVKAPQFVADPDRREELARFALSQLGLRPAGESVAQAQDRLTTLSTAERQRVIRAARVAEERSRQIREAMAKQAAYEAADKWNRE